MAPSGACTPHGSECRRPPPDPSQLDELVEQDLAIWERGWVASPFRGGRLRDYLWNFYLTDHESWGRLIPPIFAGSLAPWRQQRRETPEEYHDFFHLDLHIHLWDLVEDSPLFDQAERRAVAEMLVEQLRHLAGLFYLTDEVNPDGLPRQNHVTFIGLNLAAGHDYLSRCYGLEEFAGASARTERIFAGQATGYKPNDDAGVGYVWAVPRHTLDYLLSREDDSYLEDGHVAELCRLAAITTDNLRSEVGYGDTGGFAAFEGSGWRSHLWPFLASLWHSHDPEHLWLLNWLGEGKQPPRDEALEGLRATVTPSADGFTLAGVEPTEPTDLLGVTALDLPASALRWVAHEAPERYRPDPERRHFDKLSLRAGFAPEDEYLLLEGVGTFCHGHEDTNAILRLTWNGRAWLADGHYIRAAPKYHDSVVVLRDGVGVLTSPGDGVVIPPLATLNAVHDGPDWGLVQSEAAGYNGIDWRRNLVWRKGRYLAVVDQLCCREPGEYRCRCLWRLVGEVESTSEGVRLRQGEERLFLHSADDSTAEIVQDGPWGGYPHVDGPLHVLHQKSGQRMQAGEEMVFLNVFTPFEDIRVERLGPALLRVTDGDETTLIGAGPQEFGDIAVEGGVFGISLRPDGLHAAGVSSLSRTVEGRTERIQVDGEGLGRALCAPAAAATTPPATPAAADTDTGLRIRWDRSLDGGAIGSVAVDGQSVLVASEDGVAKLTAGDGAEVWRVRMESRPSSVLLADIDNDGQAEALVGTSASELVVLEGSTGRERWRRPLKNLYDNSAPATALCVADLEGEGATSVLAGTAGWFVNAFGADSTPKWARSIRYHAITAVAAADVDGDGRAEVIVGTNYSTPLSVHGSDGSFRWSTLEQVGAEGNATTPRRGIGLTQLMLCDLDGDDLSEAVYGTEDGWVFAVDPRDGSELWHLSVVGEVAGLVTILGCVVAASEFGDLYVLEPDGSLRRHLHVSEWIRGLARCGDEVLAAVEGGHLLRLDADGQSTGSLRLAGEVRRLQPVEQGVLCVLEDDRICRVDRP